MRVTREIALTEVYLDQQAKIAFTGDFPRGSVRRDAYDVTGQICAVAGFLMLVALYCRAL